MTTNRIAADLQDALTNVCAGHLMRHGLYLNVPHTIFFTDADQNYAEMRQLSLHSFQDGKIHEIKARGEPLNPQLLIQHRSLWIHETDLPLLHAFTEKLLIGGGNAGQTASLPPAVRAETLRRSAMLAVDDLFANPSSENIQRSTKVVSLFVDLISKDPQTYLVLTRLSSHDPYTLQHSVGTAVNSVILAKRAGFSKPEDLQDVGVAGLLHDIGKVRISREIINKSGPLTDVEWQEIRKHPLLGYEIVKDDPTISETTKRAILEHHEDNMGTGYPHRLKKEERSRVASIVCICDVFNALTTDRSYSKAKPVYDAFEIMRNRMAGKFDPDLFTQLVLIYGNCSPSLRLE